VAASSAQTWASGPVRNITPSITIGVASKAKLAGPAMRPTGVYWNTQAGRSAATLRVSIWSSAL
jgi:hypothetical protein